MKRILVTSASLIIALFLLAARTGRTQDPGAAQAEYLANLGEKIYLEQCAECHQVDGKGWSTLYPALAGNPIVTLHDPEPLIVTVTYGQGSMMSFTKKLNLDEIAAVLTYIRNSWGNEASPISPRQIH
ncbi:MAG TPA: c-type cytochrome [Anaerolineaceae bacterium]